MDVTEHTLHHGSGGEKEHLDAAREEMKQPGRPGGKALGTLAVLAVLYTLNAASAILLPFVLALVLNLQLSPLMRIMHRRLHLPRALAALILIFGLFVVVGGVGAAISVPATYWVGRVPEALPKLEQKLNFLTGPINYAQQGYQKLNGMMGGSTDPGATTGPACPA